MKTSKEFLDALIEKLSVFDKKGAEVICNNLIAHLYETGEAFDAKHAQSIMQQLRNKRMFKQMMKVGDALLQTGRYTYKIHKLYAQALIDQNILIAAIAVLNDLINRTATQLETDATAQAENTEANGLLGRVYKQLYVNANSPTVGHNQQFIQEAIRHYYEVYKKDVTANTWHGINVAALLYRAQKDGIDTPDFPPPESMANEVLQTIKDKHADGTANAWDFATAAEACIALNQPAEALEWLSGYARMPYCDAFELGSTLRQLQEVWQLNTDSETGRLLLPLLQAELLKREGGTVNIDIEDLQKQKATEDSITGAYNALKKSTAGNNTVTLEKVFSDESFKTYKWYMLGADRCLAVARIGRDSSKGFGTGFLLKGKGLCDALGDELILLTNAHVVSADPAEKALQPHEAIIIFEALNRDEEFRIGEILWSSPSAALDATVIRFSKEDRERLEDLTKGVKIYPVSKYLPVVNNGSPQRIYIIGHPFGGTLQLSFQDNLLLDYESPKIHYRTPTEGGSSGSPVFNQQWELIGLHHAGSAEMQCLNNKPGIYEANEGIWIEAIKKEFCRQYAPPG